MQAIFKTGMGEKKMSELQKNINGMRKQMNNNCLS